MTVKKRFKAGCEPLTLPGGTFKIDEDGDLEIRIRDRGWFSPEDLQKIIEAFPIEIVHLRTAGEVYFDSIPGWCRNGLGGEPLTWSETPDILRQECELVAIRLGIRGDE